MELHIQIIAHTTVTLSVTSISSNNSFLHFSGSATVYSIRNSGLTSILILTHSNFLTIYFSFFFRLRTSSLKSAYSMKLYISSETSLSSRYNNSGLVSLQLPIPALLSVSIDLHSKYLISVLKQNQIKLINIILLINDCLLYNQINLTAWTKCPVRPRQQILCLFQI